jgi:acetolactate synthase-1/3 small subunit
MKQEFTITIYTENQVGLLNRIAIIFSRRKINIESLNTSPSEVEGIHRFTIVIDELEEVVRKVVRQIEKQVDVLKAYFNTNDELKMELLSKSKIFVNTAEFEYGPRAMIEAIQAGVPIFTMPHIGVSDLVTTGKNGETIQRMEDVSKFYEMLDKYNAGEYLTSAKHVSQIIKPEFIYPDLVKDIKEKSKIFNENLF